MSGWGDADFRGSVRSTFDHLLVSVVSPVLSAEENLIQYETLSSRICFLLLLLLHRLYFPSLIGAKIIEP